MKRHFFKEIGIVTAGVLLCSQLASSKERPLSAAPNLLTYGAATNHCMPLVEELAISNAEQNASVTCIQLGFSEFDRVIDFKTIHIEGGSCWAGLPAAAIVEIEFSCK